MSATRPPLLRPGVLDGVRAVLAGAGEPVAATLAGLGARVEELPDGLLGAEQELPAAAGALDAATVLVADARGWYRDRGLEHAVETAWAVVRAAVNGGPVGADGGGRIVLIAPRPADGADAVAVRAAFDNLARTTSVEWARLGIRVVAVLPGDVTPDAAVADVLAFVASPAGGYYSGCSLELGSAGLTGSS